MSRILADIQLHDGHGELLLTQKRDEDYGRACDFIAQQFKHHFGATITQFMPAMICLLEAGEIRAVARYRQAGDESLFLEQYLDVAIETAVATVFYRGQFVLPIPCFTYPPRKLPQPADLQ